jgi:hypothetical protein
LYCIEKPGYSEIEKVHFAVTLLDGECRTLVAGLKDPTYDDVITALENKYGDVMSRIQKAVLEIASIHVITTLTLKDLEPFYGKLLSNWNYLRKKTERHCDLQANSWIFTALVRPKVPKTLIRRWDAEQLKRESRSTPSSPLFHNHLMNFCRSCMRPCRSQGELKQSLLSPGIKMTHRIPSQI